MEISIGGADKNAKDKEHMGDTEINCFCCCGLLYMARKKL